MYTPHPTRLLFEQVLSIEGRTRTGAQSRRSNELSSHLPLLVYTTACLEGDVVERCELVFWPYAVSTATIMLVWDIFLALASRD